MRTLPALGSRTIATALATVASAGLAVALAAPAAAVAAPAVAGSSSTASAGISFLSAPPNDAVVGDHYTVRVRGGGATTPVELDTQDASACSISNSVVTFVAEGTCLVEAHQDADATHAEANSAQLVDVGAAPPASVAAAAPVSSAPVSSAPVSTVPVSSAPVSTVPASTVRVVAAPVAVDTVAPRVAIVGVRAGAAYRGAGPRARCHASDSLSGVARCSLTSTRHGHVVTVRARALDRAGNASQAVLRYRVHTG